MYFKSIKKIYQILNVKEKLIVSIFFISTFFSIIIETISIGIDGLVLAFNLKTINSLVTTG